MKTIILGGGFSTRLYPLTEFFPKSLLKIKEKEIIKYLIEDLITTNCGEIACISNNRYFDTFDKWFKKNFPQIKLINNGINMPEDRLGAIGDILFTLEELKWEDDLLVLSSDTLSSLKLANFINFYQSHQGVVNAVFDTKNTETIRNKLGCVKLNSNNEIVEFEEKPENPQSTLTSIPYYIFPKSVIPLIKKYKKEGHNLDAPGSIIHWLIKKTQVYGFIETGYYYDVGTKETFNLLK
jgi:glucose-1-phosphate thymidylyltransferase